MSTNKGPFVISAQAGTVAHLVLDRCRALYAGPAGSNEVRFVTSDDPEDRHSRMEVNLIDVSWIRCGRFFSMYPNRSSTLGCVLLVASKTRTYPSRINGMAQQILALIGKLKANDQTFADYQIVRTSVRRKRDRRGRRNDSEQRWAIH